MKNHKKIGTLDYLGKMKFLQKISYKSCRIPSYTSWSDIGLTLNNLGNHILISYNFCMKHFFQKHLSKIIQCLDLFVTLCIYTRCSFLTFTSKYLEMYKRYGKMFQTRVIGFKGRYKRIPWFDRLGAAKVRFRSLRIF